MGGHMRRSVQKDLRREQLLNAAARLFSCKGFYNTYVDDIIKEAGIGKGTFYRNFKNKEELFVELLSRFLLNWQESVSFGVDCATRQDYVRYIKRIARQSFLFFRNHNDLSNLYFRLAPGLSAVIEPYLLNFEHLMLDILIEDFSKAQDRGLISKKADARMAANMIAGAFFRVHYYYCLMDSDANRDYDIDQMVEQFTDYLFKGILAAD